METECSQINHKWDGPHPSSKDDAFGDERRRFNCARCGSSVVCYAFGEFPKRREFGIELPFDEPLPYNNHRRITGWEIPDGAARKAGIPVNCDEAVMHNVMRS